jgi:uncharacterized protein YjbI with pentapeptide repeats
VSASTLAGANFAGAVITEAEFGGSDVTAEQLAATTNYLAKDLHGLGLARCDLTGGNFADQNLAGANLRKTILADADLSLANLTGAYLSESDVGGADLSGAIVVEADFANSNLTVAQLSSTASYQIKDLHGIGLTGINLAGANLAGQNLTSADLRSCALAGASFSGANLTRAYLSASDLTGANLAGANLTRASLASSTLADADLTGATVTETAFDNSDLTVDQLVSTASYQAKNLRGIGLTGVDLTGCNLAGQNLSRAKLQRTILAGADLTGADLTQAYLSSSILTSANLSGANLYGADLSSSNLIGANLRGANLVSANLANAQIASDTLFGVDLSRADLRRAAGISLASAVTRNAILPDGTIKGLALTSGETLTIRNTSTPLAITISQQMVVEDGATLQILLDGKSWGSTISFADCGLVSIAGQLELALAPDVSLGALAGQTFKLFDWTGVHPVGQFQVVGASGWDLSRLSSLGEVTYVGLASAVPEPSSGILFGIAAIGLWMLARRRNRARP